MDIIELLPNPETDIKTPTATPEDFFWSLVVVFIIMILFGIYR